MNHNDASGNRNIAIYKAVLRGAVSVYLIYLGVTLVKDHLEGASTLAPWIIWTCGPLFVIAGAVFGWMTWKRYRADMAEVQREQEGSAEVQPEDSAEIQPEEAGEELPDPEELTENSPGDDTPGE